MLVGNTGWWDENLATRVSLKSYDLSGAQGRQLGGGRCCELHQACQVALLASYGTGWVPAGTLNSDPGSVSPVFDVSTARCTIVRRGRSVHTRMMLGRTLWVLGLAFRGSKCLQMKDWGAAAAEGNNWPPALRGRLEAWPLYVGAGVTPEVRGTPAFKVMLALEALLPRGTWGFCRGGPRAGAEKLR